jgi:hypothetical protein
MKSMYDMFIEYDGIEYNNSKYTKLPCTVAKYAKQEEYLVGTSS